MLLFVIQIRKKGPTMTRILSILTLLGICLSATAEELPASLLEMRDGCEAKMKVWNVNDDDMEDRNDEEFASSAESVG